MQPFFSKKNWIDPKNTHFRVSWRLLVEGRIPNIGLRWHKKLLLLFFGIGASIRIDWEIECLPYVGFLKVVLYRRDELDKKDSQNPVGGVFASLAESASLGTNIQLTDLTLKYNIGQNVYGLFYLVLGC